MNESRPFLGTGWHFPPRVNGRGAIELARGERDVQEAITIVLSTPVGERRMRPTFGCAIHDLVFSPNSATTHGLIRQHVFEALTLWEPRIEVRAIDVGVDPEEPGCMLVDIRYAVRATNELRNLVYPFYVIPEEPGPERPGAP